MTDCRWVERLREESTRAGISKSGVFEIDIDSHSKCSAVLDCWKISSVVLLSWLNVYHLIIEMTTSSTKRKKTKKGRVGSFGQY